MRRAGVHVFLHDRGTSFVGFCYCPGMNTPPDRPPDSVDPKLLEILVCPVTKGPLEFDAQRRELISRQAKLAFPIRDGIPIMLADEARRLE